MLKSIKVVSNINNDNDWKEKGHLHTPPPKKTPKREDIFCRSLEWIVSTQQVLLYWSHTVLYAGRTQQHAYQVWSVFFFVSFLAENQRSSQWQLSLCKLSKITGNTCFEHDIYFVWETVHMKFLYCLQWSNF